MLAYNKTFGKHNINAVLAYEVMKYDYEDMYGEKQVYGQTLNPSLDNGAKPADLTNTRQEDAMVSYVGSLNYGYNDKYYAGFSFRRDGSSRLAPDTRWGELLGCFRFMETLSGKLHETVGECGVGYEIKSIVWCER